MLGGGARRVTSSPAPSGRIFMETSGVIPKELLEVLACPKCKRRVELSEDGRYLLCTAERLRYPIVDDIPVMLVEEAEPY